MSEVKLANRLNRVIHGQPTERVLAALSMLIAQNSMDQPCAHIDLTLAIVGRAAKAYHHQNCWGPRPANDR